MAYYKVMNVDIISAESSSMASSLREDNIGFDKAMSPTKR